MDTLPPPPGSSGMSRELVPCQMTCCELRGPTDPLEPGFEVPGAGEPPTGPIEEAMAVPEGDGLGPELPPGSAEGVCVGPAAGVGVAVGVGAWVGPGVGVDAPVIVKARRGVAGSPQAGLDVVNSW
jgi:hypothetical protein